MPESAVNVAFGPTTASVLITSQAVGLKGFCVAESTGTNNAKVVIRDGTTTAGKVVDVVTLAPNESVRDWYGPDAKRMDSGIFLHVVSGQVEGSVSFL
jgi:hypothetical protein